MPGITGIIRRDPYEGIERDLDLMVEAMRHEAFYRSGQYVNRALGVYVGWMNHEASFADCMPLVNDRRDVILIFQGENYLDSATLARLRQAGNGLDDSSAQYLLRLYEETGDDFFRQLNGWFCGLVIDLRAGKITLFNDRYGMSRIYVHQGKNEFLFASEAKSLLKVRPALRAIEPAGLAQYLRYNCTVGGQTLFKDVFLLPNGSSWIFDGSVLPKKQSYFDPTQWEQQPTLPPEEFYQRFADTIRTVFPRYVRGRQKVALALTAGLDTRAMATVFHACGQSLPCYTFGGTWGETLDIRRARKVAKICNTSHEVISIDQAFFKAFAGFAQRSVYLSDGTHDALAAHDVYLNQVARTIAPIRLTGKFGSEVVKTRRVIPWIGYSDDFVQADLKPFLDELGPRDRFKQKNSLLTTVFEELPWYEFGGVAVEQSQVGLRTPYLDNDLVRLMFQAPSEVRAARQVQARYVRETSPELGILPTNLGDLGRNSTNPLISVARYILYRALFKMEYIYLFATPRWVTWLDRRLERLRPERIFAGREKFEGYRIWIRTKLSEFIQQTLLNPSAQYTRFFNKKSVERMLRQHIAGTGNHLNEINKVLTTELICSSLLQG
jgi:asparagine synthase (glutamine-hydrolysing)